MKFTVFVEEKRKSKVIVNAQDFASAQFEVRKLYNSGDVVWTEHDISSISEEITYTENGVLVSAPLNEKFWNNSAEELLTLLYQNGINEQNEVIKTLSDTNLTLSILNHSKNEKFLSFSTDILKSIIMTATIKHTQQATNDEKQGGQC